MAARSFQIAGSAGIQRMSDVYIGLTMGAEGGPATNIGGAAGKPDARSDVPYRQIVVSASGGAIFIGGSDMSPAVAAANQLSTTTYGLRLDSTATTPAQILGAYETGPMKLSDFWFTGSGGTLHILATPF